ncbi:uncharacterized protein [Palaemon carinicauda]|uniref:uncharacterized protein n=1 Tax=Palaemon carinicauda TaxID=392227 RepID=UPI0035B60258
MRMLTWIMGISLLERLENDEVKRLAVNTAILKLHNGSENILIDKGARQEDTITPKFCTDFKNSDWENVGIYINGEYLDNMKFTDDIVPFSESRVELQKMIEDFNREQSNVGLKMIMNKPKIIFNENAATINNGYSTNA